MLLRQFCPTGEQTLVLPYEPELLFLIIKQTSNTLDSYLIQYYDHSWEFCTLLWQTRISTLRAVKDWEHFAYTDCFKCLISNKPFFSAMAKKKQKQKKCMCCLYLCSSIHNTSRDVWSILHLCTSVWRPLCDILISVYSQCALCSWIGRHNILVIWHLLKMHRQISGLLCQVKLSYMWVYMQE